MAASYLNAPEAVTQAFKPVLKQNVAQAWKLTSAEIAEAEQTRARLYHEMRRFLGDFDALACPVVGNLPRLQSEEWVREVAGVKMSGYMDWLRFAFLATTCGLPAISVPVGLHDGRLPVGIQLIGKPRGEAGLLAAARAVEMAVGGPFGPIDPVTPHGAWEDRHV